MSRSHTSKKFVEYVQRWSVSCELCCCLHLQSASKSELRKCCLHGKIDEYPRNIYEPLAPLPPYLKEVIVHDKRFSRLSSTYNNILSFAATGIQNDSGGGFVNNTQGESCVTINGRVYHFLPQASNVDPKGGISYFIFDLPDEV